LTDTPDTPSPLAVDLSSLSDEEVTALNDLLQDGPTAAEVADQVAVPADREPSQKPGLTEWHQRSLHREKAEALVPAERLGPARHRPNINPVIPGRIVMFFPSSTAAPMVAMITHVYGDDDRVDLTVFRRGDVPTYADNVPRGQKHDRCWVFPG